MGEALLDSHPTVLNPLPLSLNSHHTPTPCGDFVIRRTVDREKDWSLGKGKDEQIWELATIDGWSSTATEGVTHVAAGVAPRWMDSGRRPRRTENNFSPPELHSGTTTSKEHQLWITSHLNWYLIPKPYDPLTCSMICPYELRIPSLSLFA